MTREVLMIAGARPNFMKLAPISAAIRRDGRLSAAIVHTGQHYDRVMSDLFFDQLGIPEPEIRLGVGSASHAVQTAELMVRLEPVLLDRRPAIVVVVGDVNSTVAAALVASKLSLPVAHVEAGLRSFDRTMPEEINRIVTDVLSDLLFVTERSGLENLKKEGVSDERVHFVGNVMIDTLLAFRERASQVDHAATLDLTRCEYAVLTLHRPSNVDDPGTLAALLALVGEVADRLPVIFPVHPRTRRLIAEANVLLPPRVRLLEPLGYLEFVGLMDSARLVLTDSGGIQEETTVLGVPCVTIRENTERPVTVLEGSNRLAGTSPEGVRAAVAQALAGPLRMPTRPELWDGKAAPRIVDILARYVGA